MDLTRFLDAQARTWPSPLDEIVSGRKHGHWMWYIFPQLRGLGQSAMAQLYGIADLDEARDYVRHDLLGARLKEISKAMLTHVGTPARAILGPVDTMKLRSSMTLFHAAKGGQVFGQVLEAFFDGQPCRPTLDMTGGS